MYYGKLLVELLTVALLLLPTSVYSEQLKSSTKSTSKNRSEFSRNLKILKQVSFVKLPKSLNKSSSIRRKHPLEEFIASDGLLYDFTRKTLSRLRRSKRESESMKRIAHFNNEYHPRSPFLYKFHDRLPIQPSAHRLRRQRHINKLLSDELQGSPEVKKNIVDDVSSEKVVEDDDSEEPQAVEYVSDGSREETSNDIEVAEPDQRKQPRMYSSVEDIFKHIPEIPPLSSESSDNDKSDDYVYDNKRELSEDERKKSRLSSSISSNHLNGNNAEKSEEGSKPQSLPAEKAATQTVSGSEKTAKKDSNTEAAAGDDEDSSSLSVPVQEDIQEQEIPSGYMVSK